MVYNEEVQISLLTVSCLIITAINTTCIYVIYKSSKLRKKPPTILIGNLIGTHMIQGVCVLPLYIIRTANIANDVIQPYICAGFWFTYMLTFYSATVSVFLLSLDRVLAVRLLTKYETYVTSKNVLKTTILAWSYIVALCLLPFFGRYMARSKALTFAKCHYLQQREWTIFMLIANALVPYLFIVVGYIYVHKKLRKLRNYFSDLEHKKGISLDNVEQNRNEKRKRKFMFHSKITRLTFIVVLTYGITWFPTIIYYLLQHICLDCFSESYYKSDLKKFMSFLMKYINFFDAIIAPVIYCYFHDDFRMEFKRIVFQKTVKNYTTNESIGLSYNNNMYSNTYADETQTTLRCH